MFSLKDRVRDIVIKQGGISAEDFESALVEQKTTGEELLRIFVKRELTSKLALQRTLSQELALPPMDISRLKIDVEVVQLVPQNFAVKYKLIPIARTDDRLTLAIADPLNLFVVDNVAEMRELQIIPIIASEAEILKTIQTYHPEASGEKLEDIIKDIESKGEADFEVVREGKSVTDQSVEDLKEDAPIIKLTDTIIKQSVKAQASDVFIEPMENTLRIRYRVDGVIREIDKMAKALLFPLVSRIKVISSLDISEHRLPQDGRFRIVMDNKTEVDFRVSVLPTIFGEKIVMRVLNKDSGVVNIDKLGFEEGGLDRIKKASKEPHGMILACGPTGSGKTTTLYSILKFIDTPEKNIVTVEDPVEYEMKGANQVNVKASIGLSFAAALRSILRQDPDIIMIGEVRDAETLDIAVKAALTGHLVLSSLHTTTAAGSVIRMINMGIEPFLICSSVNAIIAQRLIRSICPHCKEAYNVVDPLMEKYELNQYFEDRKPELFRGKGCKKCLDSGYQGRVGITEVLTLSPEVKKLILNHEGEQVLKKMAMKEGMVTMRQDGMRKACSGLTTLEEVIRITAPDKVDKSVKA